MEKLHDEGCKLPESLVIDDPSASAPAMLTSELRGSDDVKTEILEHLMGDKTNKIGVWGMGGVGKTTIMKHVYNQLLKGPKFKKVIWVTVSQTFDIRRIQQEIASGLGENLLEHQSTGNLPEHEGRHLRATTLSKMLESHKPYVLILDNVWEPFELHEVGIPKICGFKLVLTTRSETVARIMDCKRIKVNTLSHDASLKLFKDKVGIEALSDDGGAEKTLEEMVRECDGLPLAIITVAAKMKGISDPCMWRAVLNQLKKGKINVAGTENDQFRALKFSYDWLRDEKIKHCFLRCAMYPEDEEIPKEELIEYWIDEGLIDVMGTRQDMKDQGLANLKKLVENCLLEYVGDDQSCVKMHDLLRDMALSITRTSSPRFLVKAGGNCYDESTELRQDISTFGDGNMVLSLQLLIAFTNNFSEENILGRGGFATVYKGESLDGAKVAVKRMKPGIVDERVLTEFKSEIAILSRVQHRNLVGLLGYCIDGNERLLVYEYMPQGTLSRYLFKWKEEGLKPLEWTSRLRIALDVARGVEYLHILAQQSYIHRDIKSPNILLGDDMRAKVADFGFVRQAADGSFSVETRVVGSFGYLAPEYAESGRVTKKADVYSFGVVLMELITGRKAVGETIDEETFHLVTWFRKMLTQKGTFREAIDQSIELDKDTLASIRTVAKLAGRCSAKERDQRPTMNHVVSVLSSLAENWEPAVVTTRKQAKWWKF